MSLRIGSWPRASHAFVVCEKGVRRQVASNNLTYIDSQKHKKRIEISIIHVRCISHYQGYLKTEICVQREHPLCFRRPDALRVMEDVLGVNRGLDLLQPR